MTELARRRTKREVVTCFCVDCDRVLYLSAIEEPFCPVCSSAVQVMTLQEPAPSA